MPFALDHIFICTKRDAPEAAQLAALGLTEGRSGIHQGQGTANRCFVFHNAYLELIWVHDETEARSPLTERTRLFERWKGRTNVTCPFGICLRPMHSPDATDALHTSALPHEKPFAGWDYLPQYVPASRPIHIGANSNQLDEPMLFFIETATRPDSWLRLPALQHRLGVREITRLTWHVQLSLRFPPQCRQLSMRDVSMLCRVTRMHSRSLLMMRQWGKVQT
jgi:Glyoxalase-like domain